MVRGRANCFFTVQRALVYLWEISSVIDIDGTEFKNSPLNKAECLPRACNFE